MNKVRRFFNDIVGGIDDDDDRNDVGCVDDGYDGSSGGNY
jgi:hypothetical protein